MKERVEREREGKVKNMVVKLLLIFIAVLTMQLRRSDSIEWLAVARRQDVHWNRTSDCLQSPPLRGSSGEATAAAPAIFGDGLSRDQRRICRRTIDLMPTVISASERTINACQGLFHNSRWNCSSILLAPNFTPDLTQGSREQGVVYALASATLAHAVAKACSSAVLSRCSCGQFPVDLPRSDFRWGGCSDNLRFGLTFSRVFTDQKSGKVTKRFVMNLHNSNVGRKTLAGSLITSCKCHGVSGSCSVKTCWKSLPELKVIGSSLLNSYYVAVEVKKSQSSGNNTTKFESMSKISFSDNDLIFYNKSPDYCLPDESLGSLGTQDRECTRNDTGSIGCQSMCCGRGFRTQMIERSYRCECKYYWCCYVKCKLCTTTVEVNRCR